MEETCSVKSLFSL